MACCYIAASMIALIINSAQALDIDLHLQYNESATRKYDDDDEPIGQDDNTSGHANTSTTSGLTILSIIGMTCAACVHTVETAILEVKGVDNAIVNLALQEARLFHSTKGPFNLQNVLSAIRDAGYDASVGERAPEQKIKTLQHTDELALLRRALQGLGLRSTLIFSLGIGFNFVFPAFVFRWASLQWIRSLVLFGLTVDAAARQGDWIFQKALAAASVGRVNMHSLIAASTCVGLGVSFLDLVWTHRDLGHHDTVVGILLIITIGRYMDLLSRRSAANTFIGLYALLDETSTVHLVRLNKRVPSDAARAGDEILIRPHQIIPCDSYVTEGTSHANEAIITGESMPKSKSSGDLLLAGSRNGPGELRASVLQNTNESFLSQLIKSVERSLSSKTSAQHRVDSVTQYFVIGIFVITVCASTVSFLQLSASGDGLAIAFLMACEKAMTVLAAACPCALGLATPCAVMAGIDVAWQKGILMLEGGETMELAQQITRVVMDKTGTLTQGTPTVTDIAISSRWETRQDELATLICAAEERVVGMHPLASAVFRRLLPMCGRSWQLFQSHGAMRDLELLSGRGVKCEAQVRDEGWREVIVGSLEHMRHEGIGGLGSIHEDMLKQGSVVLVGVDGELAASIVLQDSLKEDAKAAIDLLKARGVEITMLTGDNEGEAQRISCQLGISVAAASATPEQKLEHIRGLQARGEKVMMVGDGMNDGPSLAAAEIGVMMAHGRRCLSAGGSVLILNSQLQSLATLLDISQGTMWQVSANIVWAMAYNTIAVGLAVGVAAPLGITVTPAIASMMMSFSSMSVTLTGILLRRRLLR